MLSTDLITYILKRSEQPTTLVICSTKEAFLKDLLFLVNNARSTSAPPCNNDSNTPQSLLIPTIHLISGSANVHLAFVPTLPHLRAYLATYSPTPKLASSSSDKPSSNSRAPLFAIWGLALLHRSTADYSAQGLSRTLALAAEAAFYAKQKLVLAEPQAMPEEGELERADDPGMTMGDPWKYHIPLLSSSIRYGVDERSLAGNVTEVGRVISKWCKFTNHERVADLG